MIIYNRTQPRAHPSYYPLLMMQNKTVEFSASHIDGFAATNLKNDATDDAWINSGNSTLTCTFTSQSINCVAIHAPIGTVVKATVNGVDYAVNANDENIVLLLNDLTTTTVNIDFAGDLVGASCVFVGNVFQFPVPKFAMTPPKYDRNDELKLQISEGGKFLGAVIQRRGYAGGFTLENIRQQWVYDNMQDLIRNGLGKTMFLMVRPDEGKPMGQDVIYAVITSNVKPENTGQWDYMRFTIDYRGFGV